MTTSVEIETVPRDRFSWYRESVIYPGIAVGLVALAVVLLPFVVSTIIICLVATVMFGEMIVPMLEAPGFEYQLTSPDGRHSLLVGLMMVEVTLISGMALALAYTNLRAGSEILATVIFCTYASDVLGYYGGKGLSSRWKVFERKLAPVISPGKTIIGTVCGVLAALALAAVISGLFGAPHGELKFMASVAIFTLVGVGGDLVESRLKRLCMVKDSSHLLGGMGGFLDRNDALAAASIVAYGFVLIHWL
jgi:phosphatidate cytidylyltransferase